MNHESGFPLPLILKTRSSPSLRAAQLVDQSTEDKPANELGDIGISCLDAEATGNIAVVSVLIGIIISREGHWQSRVLRKDLH